MAVNKNFVVKNGLEVNTNLILADVDTSRVGIGTSIADYTLHVNGGIGAAALLERVPLEKLGETLRAGENLCSGF